MSRRSQTARRLASGIALALLFATAPTAAAQEDAAPFQCVTPATWEEENPAVLQMCVPAEDGTVAIADTVRFGEIEVAGVRASVRPEFVCQFMEPIDPAPEDSVSVAGPITLCRPLALGGWVTASWRGYRSGSVTG